MPSLFVSAIVATMLTCAGLASAGVARAQTADEYLEHGVALREVGRDEEALAIFQSAHALSPSAEALAQIGLAEQALGRLVDAETHLAQALSDTTDRFVRRNRAPLSQALSEISSALSNVAITGGPPGAEVRVEGEVRGTLPLEAPLRVEGGTVHVEITAAGYEAFAREVIAPAGSEATLEAALTPVPEPAIVERVDSEPEPAPADPGSDAGWRLPLGIALAGAGVVAIGVASGLLAWREDAARARLTCSDTDPACRALYGTAIDAEAAGIATFVVGGLLAAAGGVFIALELTADESPESASIRCAPGLLQVGCVGTF